MLPQTSQVHCLEAAMEFMTLKPPLVETSSCETKKPAAATHASVSCSRSSKNWIGATRGLPLSTTRCTISSPGEGSCFIGHVNIEALFRIATPIHQPESTWCNCHALNKHHGPDTEPTYITWELHHWLSTWYAFKVSRPALLYKRLASWEDTWTTWSWQEPVFFWWMFRLHAWNSKVFQTPPLE